MTNDAESLRIEGKTLDEWFNQRFDERMAQRDADHQKVLSMMIMKGTLDWAYTIFIIASTAAALGWRVTLFFTFYGLSLLKKRSQPQHQCLG